MIKLGGSNDLGSGYGLLLMSAFLLISLSTLITFCYPTVNLDDNTTYDELIGQYTDFTGSRPSSEAVWCLSGIYSSVGSDGNGNAYSGYGYTDDGWVYGLRVVNYTPTQYSDRPTSHNATYDSEHRYYTYTSTSTLYNKHDAGDLYASVVMDASHQSDMFFSSSGKVEDGNHFYYQFSSKAYRYAFQPINEYTTVNADGQHIKVIPNQSSLSLIWYNYYAGGSIDGNSVGGSGIAGQLIISYGAGGQDYGVAYLTSAQIVSAFNSDTSTSKFVMTFNGVDMNVYIKLDPSYLSQGLTVEQCYNLGYWSIMVTSMSVDTSSVVSADHDFNPYKIFQTMIDLLTFHTSDYGLTGMSSMLASMIIVIPLMVGVIVLGLNNYIVLILAGLYGVLSAWSWGLFS